MMEWKSADNKYLVVRQSVVLTPIIDPVIAALDSFFEAAGFGAEVTSGLRNAEDQLRIIRQYSLKHKVDEEFPEIRSCDVMDIGVYDNHQVYLWQTAWSRLLNLGIIVNPPVQSTVLFDYFRDGLNRKGALIQPSPHFKGTAFDIGGDVDGIEGKENELAVMQAALDSKQIPGLKGILAERRQSCVHVDCREVPVTV